MFAFDAQVIQHLFINNGIICFTHILLNSKIQDSGFNIIMLEKLKTRKSLSFRASCACYRRKKKKLWTKQKEPSSTAHKPQRFEENMKKIK